MVFCFVPALFYRVVDFALADEPQPEITREDYSEKQFSGRVVKITNYSGDIRTRISSGSEVDTHAVIQDIVPGGNRPHINFKKQNGDLHILVGSADPADRVDLTVFIPKGVTFEAESDAGAIEVKGLISDLNLISKSGPITIRSTTGNLSVTNDRGSITAELMTGSGVHHEFNTTTGDISLLLWENIGARVEVATSAEITTDYSLEIAYHRGKEPDKTGVALIGDQSLRISALTKRGHVRLLRMIKDLASEELP